MDVNGIPLTGARWLSGDTLIGARDDENPSRNPYYITDIPSRLIIATGTFGMSLAGTYTCHMSDTTSPRNTIRLINAGKYFVICVLSYNKCTFNKCNTL